MKRSTAFVAEPEQEIGAEASSSVRAGQPRRHKVVPLALSLAILFASPAAAQTVIVRNAPPGSTIEAQLNTGPVESATGDQNGDATLHVSLPEGTAETTVRVIVDKCSDRVLVLLLGPSVPQAPSAGACARSEISGNFVVRPVTTFVIEAGGSGASLRLRQGPPPAAWLARGAAAEQAIAELTAAPAGFAVFGGGGLVRYRDAVDVACGDEVCTGSSSKLGYEAGAAFWLTPFLGVQAAFVKPTDLTTSGGGSTFTFESSLDARLLALAVNVGGRAGRARVYGQAGANYHEATFLQTETTDEREVAVDGGSETIPGGTQTLELKTRGWGWLFGGGLEVWATQSLAIFAEGQYANVRGSDISGGEGQIDDRLILVMAGARLRLF